MVDSILEKFDLYIINQTPTKMGFMLDQRDGAKLYSRRDERGLPDSFASGDIEYANLPPDIQKVIAHEFFNAGIGALQFEVADDEVFQTMRSLRTESVDLRCKGKAYPGPKVLAKASAGNDVVHFAEFNGIVYIAAGTKVGTVTIAAGISWLKSDFALPVTGLAALDDSYLYIPMGKVGAASPSYWWMDTGGGFHQSANTTEDQRSAHHFCAVGSTLWKCQLPNKVRSCTTPRSVDTWTGEITVGSALFDINDLINYLEFCYCMKEDGVYYIDSTPAVQHPFRSLASLLHSDSGKKSDVFLNKLYFRMGNQQEWEVFGSTIQEITPSLFAPGISEYAYECVARAHDESWLYAIMKRTSTNYAILAGRWEYIAGQTRWIWHEILSGITSANISAAFVSSVEGRPYLYLGRDDGVDIVYLPVTNDATSDAGYRFVTAAGKIYSPRYTSLLRRFDKRWLEFFAMSANLSGTNYINVQKSIDDGANFTWLGGTAALSKLDTSPEETLDYPSGIESKMMNLRLDFVGNSETVPPVLKYYDLKAMTLVPSVVRFRFTVKCANGLRLKKNMDAPPDYTELAIVTFLDTIRDKICTLGDRFGTEHTVMFRVGAEIPVTDEDNGQRESHFEIEAVKL